MSLRGQAALGVRRVGERDPLVVNLDVGMMIRGFRGRDQRADEEHRLGKIPRT